LALTTGTECGSTLPPDCSSDAPPRPPLSLSVGTLPLPPLCGTSPAPSPTPPLPAFEKTTSHDSHPEAPLAVEVEEERAAAAAGEGVVVEEEGGEGVSAKVSRWSARHWHEKRLVYEALSY
jgi:hypothetical protein